MKSNKLRVKKVRAAARSLISDPLFLFRVVQKIAEMGIVGERKNALVLFLAALTKDLQKSISVVEKGPSSAGKSELLKTVIGLLPSECVIERASLSKMALAHGADELKGKVLFIAEHRGAKEANYLARLLQSEGHISHEYVATAGKDRRTVVASRKGSPVIFTTTTRDLLFADDESRFLTIRADDSSQQTQDVIKAHFSPAPNQHREEPLPVWHEAVRRICRKIPPFRYPGWFEFLADQIPSDEPRARRDAMRFLSLLQAVALCRCQSDGRLKKYSKEIWIDFADYCVAYRILRFARACVRRLHRAFTRAGRHLAIGITNCCARLRSTLTTPRSRSE